MQFAQADPDHPRHRAAGKALTAALRLATLAYGLAGLVLGVARLRLENFSEEAWGQALTIWYAEALIFLAVFGGGALVAGLFTRGIGRTRPPRLADPLKSSPLAGVERGRGH